MTGLTVKPQENNCTFMTGPTEKSQDNYKGDKCVAGLTEKSEDNCKSDKFMTGLTEKSQEYNCKGEGDKFVTG